MRTWMLAGAAAAALLAMTTAATAEGALAVGGGRFGSSHDQSDKATAIALAVQNCAAPRCALVTTFHRACVAFAAGPGGHWGWAVRRGEDEARAAALAKCEGRGGPCSVRTRLGHECDGYGG